MNTTPMARLISAVLAAVATSSLLLGMAWLAQAGADDAADLAQRPSPPVVVVASTDGR